MLQNSLCTHQSMSPLLDLDGLWRDQEDAKKMPKSNILQQMIYSTVKPETNNPCYCSSIFYINRSSFISNGEEPKRWLLEILGHSFASTTFLPPYDIPVSGF